MQDFAIGYDIPITDFSGVTKKYDSNLFKYIIDLTAITYAAGDYIKIDIISGYINPNNSNTNWTAYFKCLATFDASWTPTTGLVPCTATMTNNPSICLNVPTVEVSGYVDKTTTDVYKYLVLADLPIGAKVPSVGSPTAGGNMSDGKYDCNYSSVGCGTINYDPSCIQATGTITYSRVNDTYTLAYTDIAEYNKALNDYNAAQVSLSATYTTDPTSINHYKFYEFFFFKFNNDTCGDTTILNRNTIVHYESTFTFDPIALTLTIVAAPIDASPYYATLPVGDCNGNCDNLILVPIANSAAGSGTSASVTTGTDVVHPICGFGYCQTIGEDKLLRIFRWYIYELPYWPVTPVPVANNWYRHIQSANWSRSYYYDYYMDFNITSTDATDGPNNFNILDRINYATGVPYVTPVKIFEIAGGTITTPVGGCP